MNTPVTSLPLLRWQERVARAFSRAAPRYDALASAQRDIGETLWQTLPQSAQHVLDLGCGTGYWTQRLASHYPNATISPTPRHSMAMPYAGNREMPPRCRWTTQAWISCSLTWRFSGARISAR